MKIHKPYTYLLHHKPTDTFYYGVRWAKNCHPDEFWVKYFTSSEKLVPLYRTLFGDDSFEFEIRKVFETTKEALDWEYKVLRRLKVLKKPEKWLNRNVAGAILNEVSPNIGRIPYNKGKIGIFKHTKEHKLFMSNKMMKNKNAAGHVESEETKRKRSMAMMGNKNGAKKWSHV